MEVLIGDPILDVTDIWLSNGPAFEPLVGKGYIHNISDPDMQVIDNAPSIYREKVRDIINSYTPITPKHSVVKMHVILKDKQPVCSCPRRLSAADEQEVRAQFDEWVD